jgi:hypothetical protein
MKTVKVVFAVVVLGLMIAFQSCQKDDPETQVNDENILPTGFMVEIPSALQGENSKLLYSKDSKTDTLQGGEIYGHLRAFVHVGYTGAKIVNELITNINEYHINKPMSFTYTSKVDHRQKQLDVVEKEEFEGKIYEFKLTIRDLKSSSSENIGLELFWNRDPVVGVAIFNPHELNYNETENPNLRFRIDYDESPATLYEKTMIVSISGFEIDDPLTHPYDMSTLKMFVGKKGNIVSIYGNSEHPYAKFFTQETGFDWAFVAAGNLTKDIGVAEVGLPSNLLDSQEREVLLVENSINNVFTNQIYEVYPSIDSTTLATYLQNAKAPGFFADGHFVQAETAPSMEYAELLQIIPGLTPYNPLKIHELKIEF